jgi:hypothetical protein
MPMQSSFAIKHLSISKKPKKYYNAIASDPKNTKLCDEFIAAENRVAKCEYNLNLAYKRVDTF